MSHSLSLLMVPSARVSSCSLQTHLPEVAFYRTLHQETVSWSEFWILGNSQIHGTLGHSDRPPLSPARRLGNSSAPFFNLKFNAFDQAVLSRVLKLQSLDFLQRRSLSC